MASVLIFDDDDELAEQWARVLIDRGHYVEHVRSHADAQLATHRREFDVLVIDLLIHDAVGELSPRGGISMLSDLRLKYGDREGPKRIVITGAIPAESMDRGSNTLSMARSLGAAVALSKPVPLDEFVVAIEDLVMS